MIHWCLFRLGVSYVRLVSQVEMKCFISADMPGQNKHSLALLRHPSIPVWDEWTAVFISSRMVNGTTNFHFEY